VSASTPSAPSAEETAAITAVMVVLDEQRRAAAAAVDGPRQHLNVWVDASRRAAQRAGLQRGPWRLSGRIARRSRA
jgi:hypothetical protein